MTVFEYASGLISIVVGLGIARGLTGLGHFLGKEDRTSDEWFVAGWCLCIIFTLIGWWMVGWVTLRGLPEISAAKLLTWIFASAVLYLAAYLLIPSLSTRLQPPPRAFFFCVATHFATAAYQFILDDLVSNEITVAATAMAALSASGGLRLGERGRVFHLAAWSAFMVYLLLLTAPAIRA